MLDILLINCEASLTLTWSENCVTTSKATRKVDPDADPAVAGINNPTNATFKIKDRKLCVLSFQNENDRNYFSKYYVAKVKIKDFNVIIDGRPFF